jgi:hypothetical protein
MQNQVSMADQVRAEEREARERQRRTERLQRAAATARERQVQHEQQQLRAIRRGELTGALRAERAAAREYGRALTAYERCSDQREAQLGRALDVAYMRSLQASQRVRDLREELGS